MMIGFNTVIAHSISLRTASTVAVDIDYIEFHPAPDAEILIINDDLTQFVDGTDMHGYPDELDSTCLNITTSTDIDYAIVACDTNNTPNNQDGNLEQLDDTQESGEDFHIGDTSSISITVSPVLADVIVPITFYGDGAFEFNEAIDLTINVADNLAEGDFPSTRLLIENDDLDLPMVDGTNVGVCLDNTEQQFSDSPILETLDNILLTILKTFDDTSPNPMGSAFPPGPYSTTVTQCDVTQKDPYYFVRKPEAEDLLEAIEDVQKKYDNASIKSASNQESKEFRQQLLYILGLNAFDLRKLHSFGAWAMLTHLDSVIDWLEEDEGDDEIIYRSFKYIKSVRSLLLKLEEEYQFDIQCTEDWLYQNIISLLNESPSDIKASLLSHIKNSKFRSVYTRKLKEWQKYVTKKPKYRRFKDENQRLIPLKAFVENWPTSKWGNPPKTLPAMDSEFNIIKHEEHGHELVSVDPTTVKGSIGYFAVASHSISRTRVYGINPDIFRHIIDSTLENETKISITK